ncbi:MAG: helix-turn-helix transcriptional regulator [Sandaracinaceae bacterium]|nr:helix-turn-helix transcriptional regulator [Sandaracinaceae bacterium]
MARTRTPAAPKRGPRPSDVEVGPILLRAAAELVTERGLVEISMREVADRAGVTPAMVTYYFEGKEGLWQALMQAGMTDIRAALAAAPPDPGTPRTIESLFRQLLDTAHARPWMPVLLLRSMWGAPKQRSGFAVANAPINMAMLRALLASGGSWPVHGCATTSRTRRCSSSCSRPWCFPCWRAPSWKPRWVCGSTMRSARSWPGRWPRWSPSRR